MKILMLGAAVMLLLPAFVNAAPAVPAWGPRMDISDLPTRTYTINVPAGHAVVFNTIDGISTAPLGMSARGPPAGCLAVASSGWVSDGIIDCSASYVSHNGELNEITLAVAGGTGFADALNLATFFDYYFVSCNGPVAVSGGAGSCSESGVLGYPLWDALTGGQRVALSLYQ